MFTETAVLASVAPICSAIGHEQAVEDLEQQGRDVRGVGRRAGRRRGPAQQQLAAGQHLGPPARLHDGRAGGLADDGRPFDGGGRRQVLAHVHRRLVPAAAGEDARGLPGRGARRGRPAPAAPACAPAPWSSAAVGARRPRPPRPRRPRASGRGRASGTRSGRDAARGRRRAISSGAAQGTGSATSVPWYLTWPRRSTRDLRGGDALSLRARRRAAASSSARAAAAAAPPASSSGASTLRSRSARTSARPMP